jgi:hypothetical protein
MRRIEAQEIAALTDVLWELFHEEVDGRSGADEAIDSLARLALSLGQRDPELARLIIEELEVGPRANAEQTLSDRLRQALKLPPRER